MRLIDADVLLEQMKHRRDYVGRPSDPVCLVDDAPTVSGWVSVEDRLPESSEKYLCYQADAWEPCRINTYRWSVDRQAWLGSDTFSIVERVTHWMPLPPGPEVSE